MTSTLPGTRLTKTETNIAYDFIRNQFLVSWIQEDNSMYLVHRQLISSANNLVGDVEKSVSLYGQRYPAASFSTASGCFLVAWQEDTASETDIFGSIVTKDNVGGAKFPICQIATSYQYRPRVTYMPSDDTFLVVWSDSRNATPDIYGQILANGQNFVIGDKSGDQWGPQVAYVGNSTFLVIWQNRGVSPNDLRGRFISSLGKNLGSEKIFKKLDVDISFPMLAGDNDESLLAIYGYADLSSMASELGVKRIKSPFSGKIFLYMPAILSK